MRSVPRRTLPPASHSARGPGHGCGTPVRACVARKTRGGVVEAEGVEFPLRRREFLRFFLERRALSLLDAFELAYALVLGVGLLTQTGDFFGLLRLRGDVAVLAFP